MAQAILALSDRVTADSPRDTLSPATLALHFPGGSIGLQGTVSVGADATNQVVLEDRYVSRFHCRVVPQRGRWVLKDLSSTNGTYLDGARVAARLGARGAGAGPAQRRDQEQRPVPDPP